MFETLQALLNSPETSDGGKVCIVAILDLNERLKALEAIAIRQGALPAVV